MPNRPMSPIVLASSTGKTPSSHQSPTLGTISFCTKSRTVSRSSRSSSSKRESVSRKSRGSGVAREMSLMRVPMVPVPAVTSGQETGGEEGGDHRHESRQGGLLQAIDPLGEVPELISHFLTHRAHFAVQAV